MHHSESQETTSHPNATALTGKLRPKEMGHTLCPLGPQRSLTAPCRGGLACAVLATKGGLGELDPGWVLPSVRPGREDRQSPVSFWAQQEAQGLEFHRHSLSASSSKSLGELGRAVLGAQTAQRLETTGPMFSPSRDQWLRPLPPQDMGLPILHKGHWPFLPLEQRCLSKWQPVNIETWGSSSPVSRDSAGSIWRLPGNPCLRHQSPCTHAGLSCLHSVPPAPGS